MSDREMMVWIACGLALNCLTFITIGYLIGVNR